MGRLGGQRHSSTRLERQAVLPLPPDDTNQVPLACAHGRAPRLTFLLAACEIGARWWLMPGLRQRDPMHNRIEAPIPTLVQAVARYPLCRLLGSSARSLCYPQPCNIFFVTP